MTSTDTGRGRRPRKWLFLTAGALVSLVWFMYCPIPFLAASLVGAVFAWWIARNVKRESVQLAFISASTLLGIFAVAESYWWVKKNVGPPQATYPGSYLIPNQLLGYVPRPGAVQRIRRADGTRTIYDVTYSIDSLGLRVSPQTVSPTPDTCVVFFGDSYTLGEGVPDTATMPFRVGVRMGGRYQIRNFGLSGYGAHQMLAALQNGFVVRRLHCKPIRVIYQVIQAHVARASGRATGVRGPRYELDARGMPVRRGNLDDHEAVPLTWPGYIRAQFEKSALVSVIGARNRPQDYALFQKLVRQSARLSDSLFPGSEFHIVVWPAPNDPAFIEAVRGLGLRVHSVFDFAPQLRDAGTYRIAGDGHPNARAHDVIAAYVATAIVDRGNAAVSNR